MEDSRCLSLRETVTVEGSDDTILAAGSEMTADTGLAVALGHAVSAAVAFTHVVFFLLLYVNM